MADTRAQGGAEDPPVPASPDADWPPWLSTVPTLQPALSPDLLAFVLAARDTLADTANAFLFAWRVQPEGALGESWLDSTFTAITGYPVASFAQSGGWLAIVHPDDHPSFETFVRTLLSGQPASQQLRIVTPTDDVRWLDLQARPAISPRRQRLDAIYGAARDITEHRRQVLLVNMARELAALALADEPVDDVARRAVDILHRLQDVAAVALHLTQPDVRAISLLATAGLSDRFREQLQQHTPDAAQAMFQLRPNGHMAAFYDSPRLQRLSIHPLLQQEAIAAALIMPAWRNSQLVGFAFLGLRSRREIPDDLRRSIETIHPVVAQLLLHLWREDLLAALRGQLETSNHEVENFVGTVSHDLRSPLVTLNGMVSILRQRLGENLDEKLERPLEVMERTTAQMTAAVNELLELTRIGRVAASRKLTSLTELVQNVLAQHEASIKDRLVQIELDIDPHPVVIDPSVVQRILGNLVGNAITHGAATVSPRVDIGVRAEGQQLRLWVADNGPGIDPADHQRIFDVFQQLDPSREGTGLGLTIVKRLIEHEGGSIDLESALGQGATFTVTLPLGDRNHIAPADQSPTDLTPPSPPHDQSP